MLKKTIFSLFTCLPLFLISLALEAAPNNSQAQPSSSSSQVMHPRAAEADAIIKKDEMDETDIFAIPLDSSEVEDEEEINRLERRKTFNLGQ